MRTLKNETMMIHYGYYTIIGLNSRRAQAYYRFMKRFKWNYLMLGSCSP